MEKQKIGDGLKIKKVLATYGDGKQKVVFTTGACAVINGEYVEYWTGMSDEERKKLELEENMDIITKIVRKAIHEEFETFKRELLKELTTK